MASKILVLLGTKKGTFIAESDAARKNWTLRGPFCETWPMNHVMADPATGTIYGGGGNEWFGPAVWKSERSRRRHGRIRARASPMRPATNRSRRCGAWRARDGALYAGVQPAGLFRSDDHGKDLAACRRAAEASDRGRTGIRAAPG